MESRITPGAPYSADAVTESVQVLSDGNRIASKTATRIYRDSEGRTRREQLTTTGEVQSVSISDPVAGSMYVLNPADKTAQRNGVIMAGGRGGFAAAGVPAGSDGGGDRRRERRRRRGRDASGARGDGSSGARSKRRRWARPSRRAAGGRGAGGGGAQSAGRQRSGRGRRR